MAKPKKVANVIQAKSVHSPVKIDRRLLGTWKSDRKRTFKGYVWPTLTPPQQQRRFRALFGKMVVRWTPSSVVYGMDNWKDTSKYVVLGSDEHSVVIQLDEPLEFSDRTICHIHFEGDEYYYLHLVGTRIIEFFRRLPESRRVTNTRQRT